MRLSIIATAIIMSTSLSLVGCDSDSDFNNSEARTAKISFDPLKKNVSTPNNLLFSGSLDGTINLPDEADIVATAQYRDISLVQGALDGWQLSVPFSIPLVYGDKNASYHAINDIKLDVNSMPEGVLIYKVRASGFADNCGDLPAPPTGGSFKAGQTCSIEGKLLFDRDYTATFSNGAIVVTPLKPFSPATSYMVVVTDQLKDVQGRGVATSTGYQLLSSPIAAGDSQTVQGLKGLTQFNHFLLANEGMTDTPIYSAVFTTQSVGNVLTTLQKIHGGMAAAGALKMEALQATGATAADIADAYLGGSQPSFAAAKYYKTSINAPYYLSDLLTQTAGDMNGWAQAKSDSPIAILQLLDPTSTHHNADFANNASPTGFYQQASLQVADPSALFGANTTETAVLLANSGLTGLTYQVNGETKQVDSAHHLTAFNPIPKILSTATLEVDVYLPDTGLTGLTMPPAGWPVVIFQHGITTLKETAAAVAAGYVSQGFAVVAIDLPYHGTRGLLKNADGVYGLSASDSFKSAAPYANADAQVFANLGSFLSIRENLRQATADLFSLRAALQANGAPQVNTAPAELDGNKVHFAGQSLGSIVGVPFTALAGQVNIGVPIDYSLISSALNVPGAGLAGVFQYSPSFGPSVEAGLKTNAGYVGLIAAGLGFKDGNGSTALEKFAAYQIAEPVAAKLAIDLNYPAFAEVFGSIAQTVVDGADPLSYAAKYGFTVPTILHEVVGDGSEGSSDQTIPNTVANKPLIGTEALIATLGLEGTATTATGSKVVRFNQGSHGSLIDPTASIDVTVEMQTQLVSYAVSASAGNATVVVSNNTLTAPAI
ncbi:VolA/Pla-1 family phospholipase [Moritella dasanensis]|uniref:VolA/Pla-1 family phospholipase n=1 Tax=Moritella dasanensis TaxID=428031 RepID=UPI00031303E9|nr:VolA/Pla-1 family phospholipase [Moritella dasanensis]